MMHSEKKNQHALQQTDLSSLCDCGVLRRYRGGCIIAFQGDEPSGVFLIKTGFVKIYSVNEEGSECVYRVQGAGSMFGELSLLDSQPRSASVAALQDCEIHYIPGSEFLRHLNEKPYLTRQLLARLSGRVRQLSETLECYMSGSVYQRLKKLLEEMAVIEGRGGVLPVAMRHRDLACLLGASREVVSKLLGALRHSGYIRIDNKVIFLLKPLPAKFPD